MTVPNDRWQRITKSSENPDWMDAPRPYDIVRSLTGVTHATFEAPDGLPFDRRTLCHLTVSDRWAVAEERFDQPHPDGVTCGSCRGIIESDQRARQYARDNPPKKNPYHGIEVGA